MILCDWECTSLSVCIYKHSLLFILSAAVLRSDHNVACVVFPADAVDFITRQQNSRWEVKRKALTEAGVEMCRAGDRAVHR